MLAVKVLGRPAFVRELIPQDLKIEIEQLTADEATELAGFLGVIVGKAHNRQMDRNARSQWRRGSPAQPLQIPGCTRMAVEECRRSACRRRKSVPGAQPQVRP